MRKSKLVKIVSDGEEDDGEEEDREKSLSKEVVKKKGMSLASKRSGRKGGKERREEK